MKLTQTELNERWKEREYDRIVRMREKEAERAKEDCQEEEKHAEI